MTTPCMRYNGVTAIGPVSLPTDAQTYLDGSFTVSSLVNSNWATRNACGFLK